MAFVDIVTRHAEENCHLTECLSDKNDSASEEKRPKNWTCKIQL
jgi:hypothetical protein